MLPNRHRPRVCHYCSTPLGGNEDVCPVCGTPWGAERPPGVPEGVAWAGVPEEKKAA